MRHHEFRSFWLGARISPLEYLCIQSFLSHGHRYVLYTYSPVSGLPPDCELADARDVLPEERLFVAEGYDGRSPVPGGFSDLFRYKLLRDKGGWWVDTDVFCHRTEIPDAEYVFAQSDRPYHYLSGILRVRSAGSALMSLAFERALEHGASFEYGVIGPYLFSTLVGELGLNEARWKKLELYPWGPHETLAVLDPTQTERLERRVDRSIFCHFWNEALRFHAIDKDRRPPKGSLLDRLYDEYNVSLPSGRGYTEAELIPRLALERQRLVSAVKKGTFRPEESIIDDDFEPVEHCLRLSGLPDQLRATIKLAEQLRGRPISGEGAHLDAGFLWAVPCLVESGSVKRVYAVERSQHLLETLGPQFLRHYGIPPDVVIFCVGSLSELGLPDHSLDFVLLSQALHDADHPVRLLAHSLQPLTEIRRVLAPDGVALVIGEPLFEARLVRSWPKHLLREAVARTLPRSLQHRLLARVLTAEGWRLPDRWTRDPLTGDHSYRGSTYARLFAKAGFAASRIPYVEHSSQSFVLRPS